VDFQEAIHHTLCHADSEPLQVVKAQAELNWCYLARPTSMVLALFSMLTTAEGAIFSDRPDVNKHIQGLCTSGNSDCAN
jgi:hypothetical protein